MPNGCTLFCVNASALVNGNTITWLDWKALGEIFTYYHVETEAHDVILANGAMPLGLLEEQVDGWINESK